MSYMRLVSTSKNRRDVTRRGMKAQQGSRKKPPVESVIYFKLFQARGLPVFASGIWDAHRDCGKRGMLGKYVDMAASGLRDSKLLLAMLD